MTPSIASTRRRTNFCMRAFITSPSKYPLVPFAASIARDPPPSEENLISLSLGLGSSRPPSRRPRSRYLPIQLLAAALRLASGRLSSSHQDLAEVVDQGADLSFWPSVVALVAGSHLQAGPCLRDPSAADPDFADLFHPVQAWPAPDRLKLASVAAGRLSVASAGPALPDPDSVAVDPAALPAGPALTGPGFVVADPASAAADPASAAADPASAAADPAS